MPVFTIKDPSTGRTIHMAGDKPPAEADIKTAFSRLPAQAPKAPEDKVTGGARTLLNTTQGIGGALNTLGLGGAVDIASHQPVAQEIQKATGVNPLESSQLMKDKAKNPLLSGAQDVAGAASWMIPGAKAVQALPIVGKAISAARSVPMVGKAVSPLLDAVKGGTQGGLQAASQPGATPGSIGDSAVTGGVMGPLLSTAGNILTDKVPRYLGGRAFGFEKGTKLPDVIKAETEFGTKDLKSVRQAILEKSGDVRFNPDTVMKSIRKFASGSEWAGTPGLSEFSSKGNARLGGKRSVESGALKNIESQLGQSSDLFDFYNRLKNMAYAKEYSPAGDRLTNFMKAASGKVRESIITASKNPDETRHIMDMYAAQTAIEAAKKSKSSNPNIVARHMDKMIPGGEAGIGAIGLLMTIPGLHQAAIPLLIDAAISNKIVAPKLAKGLVKAGQIGEKQVSPGVGNVGDILKRLGIGAGVAGLNAPTPINQ